MTAFVSRIRLLRALPTCALLVFLVGCQTICQGELDAPRKQIIGTENRRLVFLPLENLTADPAAGRALRDITASALAERGLRFAQTEETLINAGKKNAAGDTGLYPELRRITPARYYLTGTVHEYRYMADLEGSPALGYTLRLVDALDGHTLWQGTAANTGHGWQSLSELCVDSARRLVSKIPVAMRDRAEPTRPCLRTGKPAYYTATTTPGVYEVDLADDSLHYLVTPPDGKPPAPLPSAPAQASQPATR